MFEKLTFCTTEI